MKFWKKGLAAAALLAVAAVTLTTYGGSSEKKVIEKNEDDKTELTVTIWNYDTTPEFEKLFRVFEAESPDITIEPVDITSDDYDTEVATIPSSGGTTDILTMKNSLLCSNYALRNQLVDLTDHVKDLGIAPTEASCETYEINGKTYAQPCRTDSWVLYCSKKMLDGAGIAYPGNSTWDEYEALTKKLSKPEGQAYGTYQHTWRSTVQVIVATQNSIDLIEPKYNYMETYYNYVLRMQRDQSQMDFGTAKSTEVAYQPQFENSRAVVIYMSSRYMGTLLTSIDDGKTDAEWGITEIPQQEKDKATTSGSLTGFVINKNSKKQKTAQEFLDFASGKEGTKLLAEVGVVPSYKTGEIDKIYFARKGMPSGEVSQKTSNPDTINLEFPSDENGTTVDRMLQEEHDLIIVDDEKPKDSITNMEKRVKVKIDQLLLPARTRKIDEKNKLK